MKARTQCALHLNKIIFTDERLAHTFMRIAHPHRVYEVYPCPKDGEHFHIRDKIKRVKHKHQKK
jgi:hypothetical protein